MNDQLQNDVDKLVKQCMENAYIDGVIQNLIEIVVLSFVYFYVVGYYTNSVNLPYFVAGYFLLAVLAIPADVVFSARNTLLKELDRIKPPQERMEPENRSANIASPWSITLPGGIIIGIAGAVIGYFAINLFQYSAYLLWIGAGVSATAALIVTCIFVHIYFQSYAKKLCSAFLQGKSFSVPETEDYVIEEHILPRSIFLAVLSLLLCHKTVSEYLYIDSVIPVANVAFSTGSTCYVIMMWMWHSSQQQVRADIMLGRLKLEADTALNTSDVMFLIHVIAGLVVGLGYLIGFIFSVPGFSLTQAMIFHLIMVLCAAAAASLFAIAWAYPKEKPVKTQKSGVVKLD